MKRHGGVRGNIRPSFFCHVIIVIRKVVPMPLWDVLKLRAFLYQGGKVCIAGGQLCSLDFKDKSLLRSAKRKGWEKAEKDKIT